jgi:hypothetical protein
MMGPIISGDKINFNNLFKLLNHSFKKSLIPTSILYIFFWAHSSIG